MRLPQYESSCIYGKFHETKVHVICRDIYKISKIRHYIIFNKQNDSLPKFYFINHIRKDISLYKCPWFNDDYMVYNYNGITDCRKMQITIQAFYPQRREILQITRTTKQPLDQVN